MERLIQCIADNVVSPLGQDSQSNYESVKAGRSGLQRYDGIAMSLLDRNAVDSACAALDIPAERYTFFEKMLLVSCVQAVRSAGIDASSERVLFVVSSTKANVSLLGDMAGFPQDRILPAVAARQVSDYFGNPNSPVVVCNACISGVCAQIEAMRAIRSGRYDCAVVTGADEQSDFIISGFKSFKAVSDDFCRPFDSERRGLNLGECAATVVLKAADSVPENGWELVTGAIRNDANHISGPSRTAEGSYLALKETLRHCSPEDLAFVNVHGTATAYNDEMESIALFRAGLASVPVTGLKGCYGHTMGAAGIMESILSMYAVRDHTVLATRGYAVQGTSYPVSVSPVNRTTDRRQFIKLLSGFGGCNAALLYRMNG